MANTFVGSIKEYLMTYPPLANGVSLDFVDTEPTEYAVQMLPELEKIEEYIAGGGIYGRHFLLNMRAATAEDADRLQNNGFFESFQDWLYEQSFLGNLPELPDGFKPQSIEALSNGFMMEASETLTTAVYSINCRLVYEREFNDD